jgi:hypothetical protein
VRFTVNGRQLELTAEDVRRKLRDVRPEPLHQYAIQIGLVIYPVKQAFEEATGVPRRGFTTQVARRVFAALGFELIVDSGQSRAEEILQADVSDVVSSAAATPARDGDWHTEARVQAMLIKYLHREGWEIVRSADTARRERGIDIEATRGIETVAIEVKGFPGRNYADPRRTGERKRTQPSTQAKGWYGRAILAAMIVRTQRPAVRAVIAFPDFPRYRELYRQTAEQLQKCDIELWWITREGSVTVAAPQPELDQPRNCRLPNGHRSPADWTLGVVTDGYIKSAIAAWTAAQPDSGFAMATQSRLLWRRVSAPFYQDH